MFKKIEFETTEQREAYLRDTCTSVLGEEAVNYLIDHGFLTAPASTRWHGAYEGGLFDHSINVANALLLLTNRLGLEWERPESPLIVGLLHDLCKIDTYIKDPRDGYIWNDDCLVQGHGIKSVLYIEQRILKLTEEETACILYHMGAFDQDGRNYANSIHKFPNVLWAHTADMIAAHILEVN